MLSKWGRKSNYFSEKTPSRDAAWSSELLQQFVFQTVRTLSAHKVRRFVDIYTMFFWSLHFSWCCLRENILSIIDLSALTLHRGPDAFNESASVVSSTKLQQIVFPLCVSKKSLRHCHSCFSPLCSYNVSLGLHLSHLVAHHDISIQGTVCVAMAVRPSSHVWSRNSIAGCCFVVCACVWNLIQSLHIVLQLFRSPTFQWHITLNSKMPLKLDCSP